MKRPELGKKNDNSPGFSLVELSIVLIIIGLLAGPFFTYLSLYYKEKAHRETLENLNSVSQALSAYFKDNGHYPCPAPRAYGPESSQAGIESECLGAHPKNKGVSVSVNKSGCSKGLCTVKSKTRLEDYKDLEDINQSIKIGGIPYRSLGIPYAKTIDGYGNKITYAVTERYATPDYKIHLGAISIKNAQGESVITPPGSAQFILVSHGEDGKGAYSRQGVQNPLPCYPLEGKDSENCDLDGDFLSAPLSKAAGSNYYDDVVSFKMFGDTLLWQVSPFNETNIYNATEGNVGIGTDQPTEKLHVKGNIRTLGKLNARELCDENGQNCFRPDVIGGTGIRCGKNEVMIGIAKAATVCAPITLKKPGASSCPDDQFTAGIDTAGNIVCRAPSWLQTEETTIEVTP